MLVRYSTKIGYLNELRQNRQIALSSYQQAYTTLKDVKDAGLDPFEIRTVAGLLMAKICQLLFLLQAPRDALGFFADHIQTCVVLATFDRQCTHAAVLGHSLELSGTQVRYDRSAVVDSA